MVTHLNGYFLGTYLLYLFFASFWSHCLWLSNDKIFSFFLCPSSSILCISTCYQHGPSCVTTFLFPALVLHIFYPHTYHTFSRPGLEGKEAVPLLQAHLCTHPSAYRTGDVVIKIHTSFLLNIVSWSTAPGEQTFSLNKSEPTAVPLGSTRDRFILTLVLLCATFLHWSLYNPVCVFLSIMGLHFPLFTSEVSFDLFYLMFPGGTENSRGLLISLTVGFPQGLGLECLLFSPSSAPVPITLSNWVTTFGWPTNFYL